MLHPVHAAFLTKPFSDLILTLTLTLTLTLILFVTLETGVDDKYKGIMHGIRTVMREEGGMGALYRG